MKNKYIGMIFYCLWCNTHHLRVTCSKHAYYFKCDKCLIESPHKRGAFKNLENWYNHFVPNLLSGQTGQL